MVIKHMTVCSSKYGDPEGEYYLCNEAVGTTPEKKEYDWGKVTCKNCLRMKRKQVPRLKELNRLLDRFKTECAIHSWDGYTAKPITSALIAKSKARAPRIIERFRSVGVLAEKIHVVPTPQASVQFEAEYSTGADEEIYMEIEIHEDESKSQ